jgi:hypothetical protein
MQTYRMRACIIGISCKLPCVCTVINCTHTKDPGYDVLELFCKLLVEVECTASLFGLSANAFYSLQDVLIPRDTTGRPHDGLTDSGWDMLQSK